MASGPKPLDRVKETTTTTGTGAVNLAGAASGYQSFSAAGTGNRVLYTIEDQAGPNWEVGLGTFTSGSPNTLSRDTVLASSNAGALVNFGAGTKNIFLDVPAAQLTGLPYNVLAFGAKGDGATDDSAAVQAAINACQNSGGGVVYFPPATYRINSALTFPANTGSAVGNSVRLTGAGGHLDHNSAATVPLGGAILDLRSAAGPARIDARYIGYLEIDHLSLADLSGVDNANPFVQTTSTTSHIHDCAFWASTAKANASCDVDAIVLGGTGTSLSTGAAGDAFQGYGTTVRECTFRRIRRGVYGRTYANGIIVQGCNWASDCGGTAAVEFLGITGTNHNIGNVVLGNVVEITNYTYGVRLTFTDSCTIAANGFYDGSGATADVRFEANSLYNVVITGVSATGPPVSDASNSALILSTKAATTNYIPQLTQFTGGLYAPAPGTGLSNERFGTNVLSNNVGGGSNTAFGDNAMNSNIGGSYNAAFGYGTLQGNTSGQYCMAFGYGAMQNNIDGNYNVAIGANAYRQNLHGSSTVALGYYALQACTASNATAAGNQAMQNVTSGGGNTGFGYGCGPTLTTGSNNTLLGAVTDVTTAGTSNGVAIGLSAVCASNECAFSPYSNFLSCYGLDSTSTTVPLWRIRHGFLVNTHGSYQGKVDFQVTDATADHTFLHAESDGTNPRLYLCGPSLAPTDGNLANGQISFWLDEAGNNLKVRVKYSSGTLKTATIALA